MPERTLQDRVVSRARRRGWKVAHAGRGYVGNEETGQFITPMAPGWPDLMMFKAGMEHPAMAWELKREQGELSEDQVYWLQLLNDCGIPAIVIKPSDLREGRVNAILDGR